MVLLLSAWSTSRRAIDFHVQEPKQPDKAIRLGPKAGLQSGPESTKKVAPHLLQSELLLQQRGPVHP